LCTCHNSRHFDCVSATSWRIYQWISGTSKLGGIVILWLLPISVFTLFICALVTTQNIWIVKVPQIRESTNGVQETSKLGGILLILLIRVGVFTWFNCGLITTRDISIVRMPQIGESSNGVWEASKLGGIGFICLFRIGVFTLFNCGLVTTENIWLFECHKLGNLQVELGKLQSLVEFDLYGCFELGCWPKSIVDLS